MSGRRSGAAAILVAALLLTGCATADRAPASEPTPVVSENPFAAGGLQDPSARSEDVADATPVRLRVPAIGVDSALEDLGLGASGELEAPVDFDLAGWYSGGVVPGEIGPAIIAGHVDSVTAPAVFARIGELAPGDEVFVAMSDGTERVFAVGGSLQSSKSTFPTDDVYSNVPTPDLRLITCAGAFDTSIGHYTDNLIVFATLVR